MINFLIGFLIGLYLMIGVISSFLGALRDGLEGDTYDSDGLEVVKEILFWPYYVFR